MAEFAATSAGIQSKGITSGEVSRRGGCFSATRFADFGFGFPAIAAIARCWPRFAAALGCAAAWVVASSVGRAEPRLPLLVIGPVVTGAGPVEPLAHADTTSPQANRSPIRQVVARLRRRFPMAPLLRPTKFLAVTSYAEPGARHSVGPKIQASPRPLRGITLACFGAERRISVRCAPVPESRAARSRHPRSASPRPELSAKADFCTEFALIRSNMGVGDKERIWAQSGFPARLLVWPVPELPFSAGRLVGGDPRRL